MGTAFKGTDISYKLTPFLRQTQDQIQEFSLDQKTGFVSGLNVGSQRSQGVEFLSKRATSRKTALPVNSLSRTPTHTSSTARWRPVRRYDRHHRHEPSDLGLQRVDKAALRVAHRSGKIGYNHVPLCGTVNAPATVAALRATQRQASGDDGCTAADVGNPYWNSPQEQIDPNSQFPTYASSRAASARRPTAFGVP